MENRMGAKTKGANIFVLWNTSERGSVAFARRSSLLGDPDFFADLRGGFFFMDSLQVELSLPYLDTVLAR
jgi:hypothetical protein